MKLRVNPEFRDMLCELSAAQVEFLVVGGYAVAAHGIERVTKDMDVWVRASAENAERVWTALARFGAPMDRIERGDLMRDDLIFQIGVPPYRIDILTKLEGLDFNEAYPNRVEAEVDGVRFACLGRQDLIRNKLAVGRPQDQADAARLSKQQANLEQDNHPHR